MYCEQSLTLSRGMFLVDEECGEGGRPKLGCFENSGLLTPAK
jgi:hypothetical protein